jgi:hypothetical protein
MSAWWIFPYLLGLFVGGAVIATMAHEGGRLLCAGTIPIRRMVIGCGPVLVRGYIRNARVELRLVPFGSLVIGAESTNKSKRWAVALYFLGGVLGNVGVIGVVVWLSVIGVAPSPPDAEMPLILTPFAILITAQIFYMVISLLAPIVYAASPRLRPYREGATRPPIGSGSMAFVRIAGQLVRRDRLVNQNGRRKAWRAVRRELGGGDLTPEEEMYALDSLVTNGLLLADGAVITDPMLRPELDLWSQRALRLGPKVKTLIASRGAVLIELGRYQEGKASLETVAFGDGASPADSLLNRIFLARAERALANTAAANRLLAEARAIAKSTLRGPALTAWIGRIQREVRDMRSGLPRVRRLLGRRSLKAQAKLAAKPPRPTTIKVLRVTGDGNDRRIQI